MVLQEQPYLAKSFGNVLLAKDVSVRVNHEISFVLGISNRLLVSDLFPG